MSRVIGVVGRALGWGALGAVCGVLLGVAIGVIHAPPDIPGEPIANEWYGVGVLLIMVVEGSAGLLLGAVIAIGARTRSGRRRTFAFSLGGAALGVGVVWVLARVSHALLVDWRDGSELVSSLLAQAVGANGGLMLSASHRASRGASFSSQSTASESASDGL